MGKSSYKAITDFICNNHEVSNRICDGLIEYYDGFKFHSEEVKVSAWENSITFNYVWENKEAGTTVSTIINNSRFDQEIYISFDYLDERVLTRILSTMWKSKIKTYNIPVQKYAGRLASDWYNSLRAPDSLGRAVEAWKSKKESLRYECKCLSLQDTNRKIREASMERAWGVIQVSKSIFRNLNQEDFMELYNLESIRRVQEG